MADLRLAIKTQELQRVWLQDEQFVNMKDLEDKDSDGRPQDS